VKAEEQEKRSVFLVLPAREKGKDGERRNKGRKGKRRKSRKESPKEKN